jgi:2-polyprenyl-6-methoxyphenol hydroxylase-like FAD-dependent oxidoreductase
MTLLGDAAHPMYPVGSNGASQAILDARVLARQLATCSTIDEALQAYEHERLPATAAVVLSNRKAGPERCMEIVADRAPNGFDDLDAVIDRAELEEIVTAYRRTAGFDPAVLNERPSLSVR